MSHPLTRRLALASASLGAGSAFAQAPPAATWTVTYVEADPAAQDAALALLRRHATTTRALPACRGLRLLRRPDRPYHFAMVETWQDGPAAEAQRAAPAMAALKAALGPLLVAPYDERPHLPMAVGAFAPMAGALFVVTHVDVVPTGRETGAAAVAAMAGARRGSPGNQGFDALVQQSRQNHFTVVEAWASEAAHLAHLAAAPTRAARAALGPLNGGLYDERLYHEAG